MIQKWYNRIMWTSLLTLMIGMLFVFPILYQFEIGKAILNTTSPIIPISGIVFMSFLFGDMFFDCRHYRAWINQYKKPLDRSE